MFTFVSQSLRKRFVSQVKGKPSGPSAAPRMEILEDRTMPSASSLNPQSFILTASPPAEAEVRTIQAEAFALVQQRVQQFAAIVQFASNVVNTLDWEFNQEVAAFEQQVAGFLGINLDSANLSQDASAMQLGNRANHNASNPSANDPMLPSHSPGGG